MSDTVEVVRTLAPYAGVLLGWLLKETSDHYKEVREGKKEVLRVIAELVILRDELRSFGSLLECVSVDETSIEQSDRYDEIIKATEDLEKVRKRIESLLSPLGAVAPFLAMSLRRLCELLEERGRLRNPGEEAVDTRLHELQVGLDAAARNARELMRTAARIHGWITSVRLWWEYDILHFGDALDPRRP